MNKTILFQGDSITDGGRNREDFYGLGKGFAPIIKNHYIENTGLEFINRGVSGDRVCHLKARWIEDCIKIKPDILFIYIGVNEVLVKLYEGFYTPHNEYERDYIDILLQVREKLPKTKIIMTEPFIMPVSAEMIELKKNLVPIRKITTALAEKHAVHYIPLWDIFDKQAAIFPPATIAEDGIHPTPFGYYTIAEEYIKALESLGVQTKTNNH